MASSTANGGISNSSTSRASINTLPSLFTTTNLDHNGGSGCSSRGSLLVSGKDLDGLIAMNDSALSQQIEFILQDAPMEQDDVNDDNDNDGGGDTHAHRNHVSTTPLETTTNNGNGNLRLHNPPNIVTSASDDYTRSHLVVSGGIGVGGDTAYAPGTTLATTTTIASTQTMADLQHQHQQQQQQHNLLNGRRIIIQTTTAQPSNIIKTEEADPELNDENLQDIEEEEQAAEAEVGNHQQLQPHHQTTAIKIEQNDDNEFILPDGMNFINAPTIATTTQQLTQSGGGAITQQTQQIVLPAGSIVGTTTGRTLTVPVSMSSQALAQLQRRPVYISNAVGGSMAGATFVRMPAVISRQPMTVLNVVQQGAVGGGNGQTTQLILQATAGTNCGTGTPMTVVTQNSAGEHTIPTLTAANGNILIANAQQTPIAMPALTAVTPQTLSTTTTTTPGTSISTPTLSLTSSTVLTATNAAAKGNASSANNSKATAAASSSKSSAATAAGVSGNSNTSKDGKNAVTYQCLECVEEFESKELFDIHRSGHTNNMKCAICNMVLKSLKNYEKHCLRCKPYECQICGRIVRFRPNFIKHMRVHTGQQSERHKYKCDVCHKEFMSFEYFKVHKKIHNENVNLTCEICGKVFSALASLRGHSKLHSGVKLHKCDVCGKGFGQRYNLKIHARTHTGDFPFECKVCKKKMHTQSSLQTHMQVHQRDPNSQSITTIKHAKNSGASTSKSKSANAGANTETIVKLEQQTNLDGPSTSGMQRHQQQQLLLQQQQQQQQQLLENMDEDDDDDEDDEDDDEMDSGMSDTIQGVGGSRIVSTASLTNVRHNMQAAEDSSNDSSNDASHELKQQFRQQFRQQQQQSLVVTPTRTIVIKNYMSNDQNAAGGVGVGGGGGLTQSAQLNQTHVIQSHASSTLQQQLLRKTPIIHSTGGAGALSTAFNSVVQQTGTSPSPSPSSSSGSSSVVVSKSADPISRASAAIGTSTIRSTRNYQTQFTSSSSSSSSNHQQRALLQRNNNHRNGQHSNNHRRRHLTHLADDDDDDDDDANDPDINRHARAAVDDDDEDDDDDDLKRYVNSTARAHHQQQQRDSSSSSNALRVNGQRHNHHHHFDDDDDDEKSSPSLATTAMIKVEPNLYSSGSGDNSNEMLIKEEVMFEDSAAPNSPHSPPSSKYRISNFDSELVDHHVDLNNSLPPYGNLFDPHSIPDTIPVQLYPDDDDFRLDHGSLDPLHQTSCSTTDGDFIKKEWVYATNSNYTINGKFGDDSDALCDSGNFIYD